MNRINTRALVEGAIFASITVLIGIIRFYIPVAALLISLVWSVPTILIAFRHGFKVSINSVVVSSVLVAIITQPIQGLAFFIGFGLPGIIMGYLLKRKLGPGKTVLLTGIVLAVCSVVSIYLGMLVMGMDIAKGYDQIFIDIKSSYSEAANSMAAMGVSREDLLKQTADFEKRIDSMKLVLPGFLLISAVIMSFVNFKLVRLVLRRINYFIDDIKPFSQWRLSDRWMIFVVSLLLCAAAGIYFIKLPQLDTVISNIITVNMAVFTILGLSVAKFFLDKYSIPKAFKWIIMFLLLSPLSYITMIVGAVDMTFDFRKLRNADVIESQEGL